MTTKAIVFGATGSTGTALVEILAREHPDWEIRAVTRSLVASSSSNQDQDLPWNNNNHKNVKLVEGDAFSSSTDDGGLLDELTKDCDYVFSCIGFNRYERKYWAEHWPVVMENLLRTVVPVPDSDDDDDKKKKKLIFCDNLYAYGGCPPGGKLSPSSPLVEPSSKSKPGIRAMLRRRIEQHMEEYPGTVTVVGASDFFGPHVTNQSCLGDVVPGKIVAGETPIALGSADVVHDFAYGPDFARALAAVAEQDKAYDRFWICPHAIKDRSVREVATDMASKVGKKDDSNSKSPAPVKLFVLHTWMIYVLSPFMGFMNEMREMLPAWTRDYRVDDSDFVKEFGLQATNYDEALQATMDFFAARRQQEQQQQQQQQQK